MCFYMVQDYLLTTAIVGKKVVWCAGSTAEQVGRVETLAGADELLNGTQGWVRIPSHLFVAILKYIDAI